VSAPAAIDLEIVNVIEQGLLIDAPHGARTICTADGFVVCVWCGNTEMKNWHRNMDSDELYLHRQGPPITVRGRQFEPETLVLRENQCALLDRGFIHSVSGPDSPQSIIVIIERLLPKEYERPPVEYAHEVERTARFPSIIDLTEESSRFTPPWRYPQVTLFETESYTVDLYVRSEGSIVRPITDDERDHVWYVLKGDIRLDVGAEGEGPVLSDEQMAKVPAGTHYRSVGLSEYTVSLLIRRRLG
jgi:mannose-6-phosphate isomerase-like protein (cupin superfamily)